MKIIDLALALPVAFGSPAPSAPDVPGKMKPLTAEMHQRAAILAPTDIAAQISLHLETLPQPLPQALQDSMLKGMTSVGGMAQETLRSHERLRGHCAAIIAIFRRQAGEGYSSAIATIDVQGNVHDTFVGLPGAPESRNSLQLMREDNEAAQHLANGVHVLVMPHPVRCPANAPTAN